MLYTRSLRSGKEEKSLDEPVGERTESQRENGKATMPPMAGVETNPCGKLRLGA
ncbi:MAG: hypothetical protein WB626_07865 [Bacteroidota bacterium]